MTQGYVGKQTIKDIDISAKRVLVRVDFNVPIDSGHITDDGRLKAAIPTIKYLIEKNAKIILCSHLGRPEGQVVPKLSLYHVAKRLEELLGQEVMFISDSVGSAVESALEHLQFGQVALLENLRFHPEEERNDPGFAYSLASLADVFVGDGFGVSHRAHASTEGITKYLPSVAGLLMEKELGVLGSLLRLPERPMTVILGGAKVSDKLGVLENFLDKVDDILIGGGMAATFIKAQGFETGLSLVEDELIATAKEIMEQSVKAGVSLITPYDVVIADAFDKGAVGRTVDTDDIPKDCYIMDIGHKTLDSFRAHLANSKTILWNGPMGVYEFEQFSRGTREIAATLGSLTGVTTVLGGGSTAEAVESLGISSRITHVSTGGGASLEFLEGKTLPGVASLLDLEVSSS